VKTGVGRRRRRRMNRARGIYGYRRAAAITDRPAGRRHHSAVAHMLGARPVERFSAHDRRRT